MNSTDLLLTVIMWVKFYWAVHFIQSFIVAWIGKCTDSRHHELCEFCLEDYYAVDGRAKEFDVRANTQVWLVWYNRFFVWFKLSWISLGFLSMIIIFYEVLYTWCLGIFFVAPAWFLDIELSTCFWKITMLLMVGQKNLISGQMPGSGYASICHDFLGQSNCTCNN